MSNKPIIGIVGLGRVGIPASKAYLDSGYEVHGYARRQEVIDRFTSMGGKHEANPKQVAAISDILLVLVLNDAQVIEVLLADDGVLYGAKADLNVVCMSTIRRENLIMVAERCEEKRLGFIDCPFTGGPARVSNGSLTLIASGNHQTLEACRPVMEVIGKITYAGEAPGLGQAIKHCNQLFVGTMHASIIEVITMARGLGLDPQKVCDVIASGIAGNDFFKLLSNSVLQNTPSPGGLGQMIKDVSIVTNTCREASLPLSVVTAAHQYFLAAKAQGLENAEAADLIKVLDCMVGRRI